MKKVAFFTLLLFPLLVFGQPGTVNPHFRHTHKFYSQLQLIKKLCSRGGNLETAREVMGSSFWENPKVEYKLPQAFLLYQLEGKAKAFAFLDSLEGVSEADRVFAKSWLAISTEDVNEYERWFYELLEKYEDGRVAILTFGSWHFEDGIWELTDPNRNASFIYLADSILQNHAGTLDQEDSLLVSLMIMDLKAVEVSEHPKLYAEYATLWPTHQEYLIEAKSRAVLKSAENPSFLSLLPPPSLSKWEKAENAVEIFKESSNSSGLESTIASILSNLTNEKEKDRKKAFVFYLLSVEQPMEFYSPEYSPFFQSFLSPSQSKEQLSAFLQQEIALSRQKYGATMENGLASSIDFSSPTSSMENLFLSLGILQFEKYQISQANRLEGLEGRALLTQFSPSDEQQETWDSFEEFLFKNPFFEDFGTSSPPCFSQKCFADGLDALDRLIEKYPASQTLLGARLHLFQDHLYLIKENKNRWFVRFQKAQIDLLFQIQVGWQDPILKYSFEDQGFPASGNGEIDNLSKAERDEIANYLHSHLLLAPKNESLLKYQREFESLVEGK